MSDFSQLVKSVKETTGTRGFGARKRAAAQIIGSEIEALGPLTGVTGQILADLTVETDRVGKGVGPSCLHGEIPYPKADLLAVPTVPHQ